ncbi:MAG TPA: helicase HerA-like domain-containing protein [Burkholderiales bacterium]|nr:helicase HerA-like domain-containing protein [Burkholderiales bacterium]
MAEPILLAQSSKPLHLLPAYANRHGLIAGATGTGKTVTLQRLAEGFSRIGVPVFMADVKGDLAGISQAGKPNEKIQARIDALKLVDFSYEACPVVFWDVFGDQGHPVRMTASELGPLLLARMLNLNDTQSGVLNAVFRVADDEGLLLLDLKDLRAMLKHVGDNAKAYTTQYGNISSASIGAIQRGLLALESQGGDKLFGEPALNIADLMQTVGDRGVVNILAADKLMSSPKMYATLLLWLLSELFENLPEVGDVAKPKLVFFFDEAHLLFNDAPPALLEKIEQVVRLIRSKGVGVYFVTQNPLDIPDTVLGQLGNRVQHALRAFTPRDQKAVKTAATTLRANPGLDVEAAITELAVGEALVSPLDDKGRPEVVERAFVVPPGCRLGPVTREERAAVMKDSIVAGVYEAAVDRESAYEKLTARVADAPASASKGGADAQPQAEAGGGLLDKLGGLLGGSTGPRGGHRDGLIESAVKSAARTIGSSVGREIVRGVLGSLLAGGSGRRRR